MEIEKVKEAIKKIIAEELKDTACHAFFFGSRVLGTARENSDLDVGIEGDGDLIQKTLPKIKSEIEKIPTLFTIDIVDFSSVGEDFKSVAKNKIETIC